MSTDVESSEIIIRSYPKAIFFYPLFIASIILGIIAQVNNSGSPILDRVWMFLFFTNVFIIAFDTDSGKVFLIVLVILGLGFIIGLWIIPSLDQDGTSAIANFFDYNLNHRFYYTVAGALGFIFIFILFEVRFDYWKIEKNELMHKKGVFANVKRYPTNNLRYSKEINDLFEFLIFQSGTITLTIDKDTVIHLETVPRINKIAKRLDDILSQIRVKMVK